MELNNTKMDQKEMGKLLVDKYGWEPDAIKKIWCFGPEGINTCVLFIFGSDENDSLMALLKEYGY